MSLVSQVKRNVNEDCLTRRCSKKKCSLKLNDLPNSHVLIDMDHKKAPILSEQEKTCDYIFIGDEGDAGWVAPLELKGGKLNASDVVEQLQSGARVADHILPSAARTRFRPVVAYRRRIHRAEHKRLQSSRVRFRRQERLIKRVKCGTSLMDALNKA